MNLLCDAVAWLLLAGALYLLLGVPWADQSPSQEHDG
jgi:hypothetical protein